MNPTHLAGWIGRIDDIEDFWNIFHCGIVDWSAGFLRFVDVLDCLLLLPMQRLLFATDGCCKQTAMPPCVLMPVLRAGKC